ncbi:MAG TPA: class I SAM-dependent methyltransferase [Tepidiformaceae bacterium]|nr:class I SAM-dependent methyltransferase [Tepidiformaceae bacterium]
MTSPQGRLQRSEGRRLFGRDPQTYARFRPDYPERVYDILQERCGLRPGARLLEIGAGAGTATKRLAAMGARVTAVEPDRRSAAYLRAMLGEMVEVRGTTFERARLPLAAFDIVVAATSFHWVEPGPGLAKAAGVLKTGGWIALFWNIFGDPERYFPFHEATKDLMASRTGGSPSGDNPVLEIDARKAEIEATGAFGDLDVEVMRWEITSTPEEIRALYSTFSPVTRLPVRDQVDVLDELERIAREEFGGKVWRPMVTIVYTARREGAAVQSGPGTGR